MTKKAIRENLYAFLHINQKNIFFGKTHFKTKIKAVLIHFMRFYTSTQENILLGKTHFKTKIENKS